MILQVTDKRLLRRRLARAHRSATLGADFLMQAVAADLVERLQAVERRFETAIVAGGQTAVLADALVRTGKIGRAFRMEAVPTAFRPPDGSGFVADEEFLPLAVESVDLFVSALALQWANDLPGALVQIRRSLKPDGLFLGAMTGGRTLAELREALLAAEAELRGGASARVAPAIELRDLGSLLQRAGFALPVVDRDVLTVRYETAFGLFADLRAMGATNALVDRDRKSLGRDLMLRAAAVYAERFSDPDWRIRATFEIVSLSGWAPHESQQKPARRGSGQVRLSEALARRK